MHCYLMTTCHLRRCICGARWGRLEFEHEPFSPRFEARLPFLVCCSANVQALEVAQEGPFHMYMPWAAKML